jgi:ketosteroid isomerase-like protein
LWSLLVVLSLPLYLAACTSADQEAESAAEETEMADTSDTSAEYEAAFAAAVTEWDRALNAGEVDAALALYVPENPMAMAPDQPIAEGREAVRALLQQVVDQTADLHNQVVESWVDGDVGVSRGTYTLTPETAGATPVTGKWVAISQRQPDGSWKIAANIWNRDAPAAPAP